MTVLTCVVVVVLRGRWLFVEVDWLIVVLLAVAFRELREVADDLTAFMHCCPVLLHLLSGHACARSSGRVAYFFLPSVPPTASDSVPVDFVFLVDYSSKCSFISSLLGAS